MRNSDINWPGWTTAETLKTLHRSLYIYKMPQLATLVIKIKIIVKFLNRKRNKNPSRDIKWLAGDYLSKKNLWLETSKGEEEQFIWLYPHYFSHNRAQVVWRGPNTLVRPWFFPWNQVKLCEWAPSFSNYYGMLPKRPIFLSSYWEYQVVTLTGG